MDEDIETHDAYNFDDYPIEFYQESSGPPLIHKRSRLIWAVVQNHVDIVQELLDSPKWYKVCDKYGYNLLQISILRDNTEVFDYLLSLPDFPLEHRNSEGDTALNLALEGYVSNDIFMSGRFAYELIKRGADFNITCKFGSTTLHCALDRSYVKVAALLVEKGAHINTRDSDGHTPLDLSLMLGPEMEEVVIGLLIMGAEPSIGLFERAVIRNASELVQEQLFLYLFDDYTNLELRLDIILKLAENNSYLFFEIFKYTNRFCVSKEAVYSYFRILSSMEMKLFKIVIEKFAPLISDAFYKADTPHFYTYGDNKNVNLENLNFMLESNMKTSVINFITTLNSAGIFQDLLRLGYDENQSYEFYCFLLSYGLKIQELDLQIAYKEFGYTNLFKLLLRMDFRMGIDLYFVRSVVPVLVYNYNMNLDKFLQKPENYCDNSVDELLNFFADTRLNEFFKKTIKRRSISERKVFPQFPLLVQLARDAFRIFFVNKFNIRTSKEFFALLDCFPISSVYKKIITFEKKLY